MWNIGNIPLVVTKWTPDELKEKPEIQSIPMWVYLKNVPMHLFSWQGLSFITSAVGHPVKLHPETASCSNFKLAKIFVNADLSKELPRTINYTKNGKSTTVEFIYPWLPVRCHTCSKWGHVDKVCVMNKKEETSKSITEIIEEGYLRREDKEKLVNEGGIDLNTQETTLPEEVTAEKTPEVKEAAEIEEGEVVKGWSQVSPGKSSSSPKMLEYGHVKIATRFSALMNIDDNGDLVEQGEEHEKKEHEQAESEGEAGEEEAPHIIDEPTEKESNARAGGESESRIREEHSNDSAGGIEQEQIEHSNESAGVMRPSNQ